MGESCWNSLQTRMPAPELAAMGQTRRRPGRGGAHNGSVAIEDGHDTVQRLRRLHWTSMRLAERSTLREEFA